MNSDRVPAVGVDAPVPATELVPAPGPSRMAGGGPARWGLVVLLAATATAAYLCRVNISIASSAE